VLSLTRLTDTFSFFLTYSAPRSTSVRIYALPIAAPFDLLLSRMMLALRPSPARTFARPLRVARTMTTTAAGSAPERFLADKAAPFCSLNVAPSFALLTAHEKAYAHALRAASWARARVILGQSTPHAARLYDPLVLLFSDADGKFADVHALREKAAVDADEWEALLRYTSQVSLA
jgi:hypothetical protein